MKYDVTKLSYGEIEEAFAAQRGTLFFISKVGGNIIVSNES